MKDKFGYWARDRVTGFQGVLTGSASYLTGCDQVCITPVAKEDNSLQEGRWYDINRVEIVGDKPYVTVDATFEQGGPSPAEQARTY